MNKLTVIFLMVVFTFFYCSGQSGSRLPSVAVRGLDGSLLNSSVIGQTGKPVIILFWATWCRPCIKEMTAIADLYGEWKSKTGVVIYAVSVDDSRSQPGIAPLVRSRGWAFEFFLDTNGEFKRAMGVVDVPHLFVLNGKGEIIYQKAGYTEGSEEQIPDWLKP